MKYSRGFTIIELLITTAILAISLGLAAPSLSGYVAKSESRAVSANIRRNLGVARNMAMKFEETLTVCGVNSDMECVKKNFKSIIIFDDTDGNGVLDGDEVLHHASLLQYKGSLQLKATFGKKYIRFTPSGSAKQAGSFIYCDSKAPKYGTRITLSLTGRSYKGRDLDGDGIIELTNGKPISC